MNPDRRQVRLHHLVVERIKATGERRNDVFHTVAADEQVRPGTVAAAYWRVQRENEGDSGREPVTAGDLCGQQMTLGGAA